METWIILSLLSVLIFSIWAGALLHYVQGVRDEARTANRWLAQIARPVFRDNGDDDVDVDETDTDYAEGNDEKYWFWCPRCTIYYPIEKDDRCPKCEKVGHTAE